MGAWDTILKYGGKAMKGMGKAANATGKSAGHAVLHPSQTLRGAGQAVKMATTGAAGAAGSGCCCGLDASQLFLCARTLFWLTNSRPQPSHFTVILAPLHAFSALLLVVVQQLH